MALFVVGTLATAVGFISCVNTGLDLGADIGAPLNRAQVAANPNDMDRYMAEVQEGMEDNDLTTGHWVIIGQNVDNDFSVAYDSVLSIRERLQEIETFETSSVEYQVGLDDVRGTIRELEIGQQTWNFWINHVWAWIAAALAAIGIAMWYFSPRSY